MTIAGGWSDAGRLVGSEVRESVLDERVLVPLLEERLLDGGLASIVLSLLPGRGSSTSFVPRQNLGSRDLDPPGVVASVPCDADEVCEPGMAAVTPRMGSVSSCSGEGKLSGARFTLAAAQRMVAAVVAASGSIGPEPFPSS
jgi:hypothetical protein